jgi:hypothetical protein
MPSVAATEGGFLFRNDAGEFAVYSTFAHADGGRRAGPGYVARWTAPDGVVLADGFVADQGLHRVSANDPALGGIAIPAWHHYRANGEPNIWNRGWELNAHNPLPCGVRASRVVDPPRIDAQGNVRASFEVDFDDLYGPVMTVRHDYIVEARCLRAWVTFTQRWDGSGFGAFLKEPKLALGFTPPLQQAELYEAEGNRLWTYDLTKIHNPGRHTHQVRNTARARVRLLPADVHVVACASERPRWRPDGRVRVYGPRRPWYGSSLGFDGWAEKANTLPIFEPDTKAYCLRGPGKTLTRNWEIAKRGEAPASLMLHAWEGGSGLPDCLVCARAFGPPGESWTAYVCVSLGDGWRL